MINWTTPFQLPLCDNIIVIYAAAAGCDEDVNDVLAVCQHPLILDAKADPEKVQAALTRLQGRMDGLHKRAATFKSYQKTFKVQYIMPYMAV